MTKTSKSKSKSTAKKGGAAAKTKGSNQTSKRTAKPKPLPKVNKPTGRAPARGAGKPRLAVRGAKGPAPAPVLDRKSPLPPLGPLLPVEPRPEDPRLKALALKAWDAALEKKALEPVLLDVRALASYADYILIVSGRSDRQVAAIGEGVREALAREGVRPMGTEGLKDGQWSLLDFGDVIVHVFYHPVREFYDLEGLWADAPRVPLEVPPEARAHYADSYAQ